MNHHLKLRDWIDVDKIDWEYLSENPKALDLLERNFDKIDWKELSKNPNAIQLLEKNLDKINWAGLSENPNALHLLERNLDEIVWECLSENPSIFEYDYKSMTERCDIYKEELIANRFHPNNFHKFMDWGIF